MTRRTSRTVPRSTFSDVTSGHGANEALEGIHQTVECRRVGRPRVRIHSLGGAAQTTVLVGVARQLVLFLQVHGDAVNLGAAEWTLEPRSFLLGLQQQHTQL